MFLLTLRLKLHLNYLAHCYLSCSNEDLLIGNFITDFLKPSEAKAYMDGIKAGIDLHRTIDTYTDEHAISLELRAMLRPRHGKYASVAVDLIWDYYLSRNWRHFSGTDLQDFADETYGILNVNRSHFPEHLDLIFDNMVKNNFLLAYANKERMGRSLMWMDRKTRFPSRFEDALHDVEENDERFNEMFMEFFPDIISHIEKTCLC